MYTYTVRFWDTYSKKEENEVGLVEGKDYSEAATEVTNYYGEDFIYEITLCKCDKIFPYIEIKEFLEEEEKTENE